jgi:hypothetical protein
LDIRFFLERFKLLCRRPPNDACEDDTLHFDTFGTLDADDDDDDELKVGEEEGDVDPDSERSVLTLCAAVGLSARRDIL